MSRILRANCEWFQDIGARKKCFRDLVRIETREVIGTGGKREGDELELSKATKRHLHLRIRKEVEEAFIRNNNITSFLWTLRNPISRAVSAFDMDHMDNLGYSKNSYVRFWRMLFYKDCGFHTAQDLANTLMLEEKESHIDKEEDLGMRDERIFVRVRKHESNETMEINCRQLAEEAVTGKAHILINSHLSANYAKYAAITTKLFPSKEILVLRTEELWSDARNLNHFLLLSNEDSGGDDGDDELKSLIVRRQKNMTMDHRLTNTHGSEFFKVKSTLNTEGKATICYFLSDENQIYEDLMRRAVNLNSEEKIKYLSMLYDDCGMEKGLASIKNTTIMDGNKEKFDWKEWRSAGCPRST